MQYNAALYLATGGPIVVRVEPSGALRIEHDHGVALVTSDSFQTGFVEATRKSGAKEWTLTSALCTYTIAASDPVMTCHRLDGSVQRSVAEVWVGTEGYMQPRCVFE